MKCFFRVLALGLPATLCAILLSAPFLPATATASPMALPMPLREDDYFRRFLPTVDATHHKMVKRVSSVPGNHTFPPVAKAKHHKLPSPSLPVHKNVPAAASYRRFRRDISADLSVLIGQLCTQRDGLLTGSSDFQSLATQSASSDADSAAYQQQSASQLTSFQSGLQVFQGLFANLEDDKGLANYDKSSDLETALKDVVNANKNALSAADVMIYNVPGLGPILGPIVYEIKCLVDAILDTVENLTDGLLNDLVPSLTGVSDKANTMTCSLKLLGLCA